MKRKRPENVERRRAMPEIDLIDEKKPRTPGIPAISRRGCAQLFGQILGLLAIGGIALLGPR